ncbi:MAG TPA: hypothetical protein VEH09_02050 [Thermodesulfobacteriota bacterium]|nr:hypothetical protein [Thermodesulfobacteriota bacterium]
MNPCKRIELILASGKMGARGEEASPDRIRGKTGEFRGVALRRRWKNMSLEIEGDEADRFREIVQTYADPLGPGRRPGRG